MFRKFLPSFPHLSPIQNNDSGKAQHKYLPFPPVDNLMSVITYLFIYS